MKSKIADTLNQLLRHRELDKITVRELVDACRISRQTFYYHFRDIMDVVEWQQQQFLDQAIAHSLAAPSFREAIRAMVHEGFQYRYLMQQLMASQRRGEIEQMFFKAVYAYLGKMLQAHGSHLLLTPGDADTILCFYSSGMVGLMLTELNQKQPDLDTLAEQLYRLLTGQLSVRFSTPPPSQ